MAQPRTSARGAKRPFIRKQPPGVPYQFGIRLGEGALSRSQWEAATSMLRWRVRTSGVRRSRFHPGRESRRSVGDQCDVIPNPSAAASQNVALYRRFGGMSDVEVFEPTSLAIVSVAMRRAGESPVRVWKNVLTRRAIGLFSATSFFLNRTAVALARRERLTLRNTHTSIRRRAEWLQ